MMKRKLTDREKRVLVTLEKRLIPLVSLETWATKTVKAINNIRRDNKDVGGPDLRNNDFTKEMDTFWESGQLHLGKASSMFARLSDVLRKKIRRLIDRGQKIDRTFTPVSLK